MVGGSEVWAVMMMMVIMSNVDGVSMSGCTCEKWKIGRDIDSLEIRVDIYDR